MVNASPIVTQRASIKLSRILRRGLELACLPTHAGMLLSRLQPEEMVFMRHVALTLGCSVVLASGLAVAQQHNMPSGKMTDEEIIKSAMSAAPETIGKGATIIDVSSDGKIRVVRQGSNQFTCMADNPNTPGPDPMCADRNAMEWIEAWLNKKEPPKNKVGFMYMLAGGTDASNTDPYAQKPEANNNWVETGPHVMIVGAKGLLDAYPRSPRPDTSVPYIMWPDTPYEHVMIPVR
jgi:hypothetical protein